MDELELEFELHPQLAGDCILLGDLRLCQVLLMNDSNYPWFILVPRRAEVTEVYHLSADDQQQLIHEVSMVSENLSDLFAARKMNVAMLGNMVPQLHAHVIVRRERDPAWPSPVWGQFPAEPYTAQQIDEIRHRVQMLFSEEVRSTGS